MSIIGINCYIPGSAAVAISKQHIEYANVEETFSKIPLDSAFPRNTLRRIRQTTSIDTVAFPAIKHKKRLDQDIKPFCKRVEYVDYKDALAMSAISTTTWNTCAVAIFDTFYTSLGYFATNKYYPIFEYEYPNNLSLFYSAAAKFLGLDPLHNENLIWETSRLASPTYSDLILDKIIDLNDNGYNLKINLEKGIGKGPFNVEIASSVQNVYTKVVLHLLNKLRKVTDLPYLAIVGNGAANIATNTAVFNSNIFKDIAVHPLSGASAVAQGAAALLDRPVWENSYLGDHTDSDTYPDAVANLIINNKEVIIKQGRKSFSKNNLGNVACNLFIPYKDKIKNNTYLVTQEFEYKNIFSGKADKYGMFYSNIQLPQIKTNDNLARVMIVNSSSNPFLNRVLELTKQQGYPVLGLTDIDVYSQ